LDRLSTELSGSCGFEGLQDETDPPTDGPVWGHWVVFKSTADLESPMGRLSVGSFWETPGRPFTPETLPLVRIARGSPEVSTQHSGKLSS